MAFAKRIGVRHLGWGHKKATRGVALREVVLVLSFNFFRQHLLCQQSEAGSL